MALSNYRRGTDKERRIQHKLEDEGYIAVRSAGSHSPIDVWAINPTTKHILLIQSKLGKLSNSEKDKIIEFCKTLNGEYKLTAELWHNNIRY